MNDAQNPPPFAKSQWLGMLVLNSLIAFALYIYKLCSNIPGEAYTQLLADYHFGFIKRALVGTVVGFAFPVLPVWSPYVLGTCVWVVTCILFLALFRRTFGFSRESIPLLIFIGGSPFFLKNFIQTLGYYDIYGCAAALALLLLPATSLLYVGLAIVMTVLLNAIHHIQMLLYIPTMATIVVIRFYLVQQRSVRLTDIVVGSTIVVLVGALFLFMQIFGTATVPVAEFTAYLQSRMQDPTLHDYLSPAIYYRSLEDEIRSTWTIMPKNLARLPVYAAIMACHLPLLRYFMTGLRELGAGHRRFILAAISGITFSYLIVFVIVFDYSRWFSNWATCMILILFAMQFLLAERRQIADSKTTRRFGWAVTLIPRIGTTIPF